ncbi:hypothetical protein PAXRUDRAFT_7805 [Paxillus rubicundulus Ve08.2h10]|uniref:Uncharacterized protein n=1 Tax=Paxillus rubicundulus Ve08.2h10 TaxID=930991 RepID=A0A0D0DPL6_9AGAM|nr:hypothetical protein PAXRUDRAFT_7805 [Paxillus rubicundulus Ve08.2h10]
MDRDIHSRPYNINTVAELRLRRHIREILLPYARIHLTTDHVAFTQKAVEDLLLHGIDYVPMADATSFLLPIAPFEVLLQSLDALDLKPHDERWTAPSETVRSLKSYFRPPPPARDLLSERCWHQEDETYEGLSGLCRPMSPILTNRARHETPKLGATKARASVPRTKSALTEFLALKFVSVDAGDEVPAPATDDVLDLRFKLDSSTRTKVRPFLQSVLAPPSRGRSRGGFDDTPNVNAFLQCNSPSGCPPHLDSPPLFPRIARPGHTGATNHTKGGIGEGINVGHVSAIAPMVKYAPPEFIESEVGDINGHHMEVVNGWITLTISSPPPPSLHDSALSEVDELWDVSPHGTSETSLIADKMEEVEIPRMHRFGHKNRSSHGSAAVGGTVDLLATTKKLVTHSPVVFSPLVRMVSLTPWSSSGSFITSFISAPIPMIQTPKPITSQLEILKPCTHSPRLLSSSNQSTTNSLLGQPPSACEAQVKTPLCIEDYGTDELPLDTALASIYVSTPHDPLSCILEEKLDDKEVILMDGKLRTFVSTLKKVLRSTRLGDCAATIIDFCNVPNLPPPTAHPKEPTLFPQCMQSFVIPKEPTPCEMVGGAGPVAFLRPVKGIKPLALDLSWRPFNFGKTIPTNEDAAGVGKPFQMEDDIPGYRDEKQANDARELLDLATPMLSEDVPDAIMSMDLGTSPSVWRDEENTRFEYVLTRRERSKVSGAARTIGGEAQAQQDIALNPQDQEIERAVGQNKILHHRDNPRALQTLANNLDYTTHGGDRGTVFDDSGVDIVDQGRGILSNGSQVLGWSGSPVSPKPGFQDDFLYEVDAREADKENVDERSENKENIPPWDSANEEQLANHHPNHFRAKRDRDLDATMATNLQDRNEYSNSATSPFEPLSFASQSEARGSFNDPQHSTGKRDVFVGKSRRTDEPDNYGNDGSDIAFTSRPDDTRGVKRRKLDDIVPASSRDLFSTFIGLRNQVPIPPPTLQPEDQVDTSMSRAPAVLEKTPPRVTPDDVFDQYTVRLPEHWNPATTTHRYLASMALIQKRALVHELRDDRCRVALVERYDLGGTDMIIDPDHGVLFIPLLALPAQLGSAVDRISQESWRFLNLLIVFEAYPSAQSYRADASRNTRLVPYAYSPPICKAIKKLRRTLGIAEGCGTMDPRCTIAWAFANHVEESARMVRCFGEEACANAIGQGRDVLWDEREWLEEEEREGESDLSMVQGMNTFAAFVMLYDRPLQSILDLSSEVRLEEFGQLLGPERLIGLNIVIEKSMQEMAAVHADDSDY